MKKIIIIIATLLMAFSLSGQQQNLLTQYFNHNMTFNPAYAGNHKSPEINVAYRNQWLGLEGSPQFQIANFHTALFDRRVGAGLGIMHSSISINQLTTADAYYAYRMKLKSGVLSLGVQATVKNYTTNFSDERIVTTQPREIDPSIPMENLSKTVPNFGFGAYYKTDNYFVGLSAPQILGNRLDFVDDIGDARERLHAYLTAGYFYEVNRDIVIQPMCLVKYVKGSPIDLDLTLFFRFVDRIGFGLNYRLRDDFTNFGGESLAFILNAVVSPDFLIGVSYDMSLTQLKDYHGGSVELFARYNISKRPKENNEKLKEDN